MINSTRKNAESMTSKIHIRCVFERPIFDFVRGDCAQVGAQHSLTVSVDATPGEQGVEDVVRRYGLKYACRGF